MRRSHLLAAVLLILATPVATSWVVGDLSEVRPSAALSYSFDPPPLGPTASLVSGAGATAVAVVSLTCGCAGLGRPIPGVAQRADVDAETRS